MYNAAPLYLKLGLYRNKEVTATGTVYFDDLRRGGTQTELQ